MRSEKRIIMIKFALIATLSLGAFSFAGDDVEYSFPNCPPGCGVQAPKKTDKKPAKKAKVVPARLR
jgi:hypothetical protein